MVLEQIDVSDLTNSYPKYLVPYSSIAGALVSSIKSIGIINPPTVIKNDKEHLILTGFKRVRIIEELGHKTLFCKVLIQDQTSFEDCVKIIYEDNKDRYTDIEIGQLCKKYIKSGKDVKRFLKLIKYPTTEKNIQRFTCLSKLDRRILNYYLDDKLNPEQCFMLSQTNTEDALLIIDKIIIPFRFNTNETRELLSELNDISTRDDLTLIDIIDQVINSNDEVNKNLIRSKIKKLRSPRLTGAEKKFNEIVKSIKLPKGVLINHSPYFENNYIELKAKIDSDKNLNELKSLFGNEEDFRSLLRLIGLVRKG